MQIKLTDFPKGESSPFIIPCEFFQFPLPNFADRVLHRVADDSARYVAEENVILLSKEELLEIGGSDGEALIARFPIRIGRWFKRFDVERGVFVSNIKGEYPDD